MSIVILCWLSILLLASQLLRPPFLLLFKQKDQQHNIVKDVHQDTRTAGTTAAPYWNTSGIQQVAPKKLLSSSESLWWTTNYASVSSMQASSLAGVIQSSRVFIEARSVNSSRLIIVDQFGFGHFQTIQSALDSIPANNTRFYMILITSGVYEEKVYIPRSKPFITIQGLGSDNTIISWHDTADTVPLVKERNYHRPGQRLGTFHSATVAINAPKFIARWISFQNTAAAPMNTTSGGQAVALQVSGDQVAFYNCSFKGRQDTLYDHKGRHYFRNCYIEGSVDFIFGDGLSMYKACEIHAVGSGSVTAQKRQNASDQTGFSFVDCHLTGNNASNIEIYLGRAWGPFSRVIYVSCYMDAIVVPQGWHNWGDKNRELTVSYSEFNCSGPGARASDRVIWSRQLDTSEVLPFVNISFVEGEQWLQYE